MRKAEGAGRYGHRIENNCLRVLASIAIRQEEHAPYTQYGTHRHHESDGLAEFPHDLGVG